MSTAFLDYHNFNPPAPGDVLAGVQYGFQATEFTGTVVDPAPALPAVLGDGYIGYYGGYYPDRSNVVDDVVFGNPATVGTMGHVDPIGPGTTKGECPMSKTSIRVDEDPVFGVNIKSNGVLTDVQGGAASIAGKVLYAIRDGASIQLDPNAGVTISKVGTDAGVYQAVFDRTAMLLADGVTVFTPQVGDDLKFIPDAEVVLGEPRMEGVEDSICIVDVEAVSNPWSVC